MPKALAFYVTSKYESIDSQNFDMTSSRYAYAYAHI